MYLQLASLWLNRPHAGFSDIHQFIEQCHQASLQVNHESAALAMLAQAAASFTDRYEGAAVSTDVVAQFLTQLRKSACALRDASAESDAEFLSALNAFAANLASDIFM